MINAGGIISVYHEQINDLDSKKVMDMTSDIFDKVTDVLKLTSEKNISTFQAAIHLAKDRINKIETSLNKKIIRKNMHWCNDINSSNYNKEIINRRIKSEKLFRKDHKYDCLILIKYNHKRPIKNKGSAIFLHLTKDYKKTAGCIAVNKKDFFIIAKILTKKSKIVI